MKGTLRNIAIIVLSFFLILSIWIIFIPATAFENNVTTIYIQTGKQSLSDLMVTMRSNNILKNASSFEKLGMYCGLNKSLRPGKYEIKKGSSLFTLWRTFRNGRQTPVKLVVTKLRTKQQLATFLGSKCEATITDFEYYLHDQNSLQQLGFDSNTIMAVVMPNTYEIYWNNTPREIFKKFIKQYNYYWNDERLHKASKKQLTPLQVITIASIVEEETNVMDEKSLIASVYLNRFHQGMRLQADPTVKFALNDFSLKRIYEKHLMVSSPFNTYRNTGLPPGPICTPSMTSIEAVLNAPQNDYLYFVAKSDFSGRHIFSATYEEHLRHAKAFQEAQDEQQRIKSKKLQEETL